jgi:2,3-bisphosphoglycerate-independent phosphoglycerate mutase
MNLSPAYVIIRRIQAVMPASFQMEAAVLDCKCTVNPERKQVVTPKPLVLMILDGWGLRESAPDNAIALADTPAWDALLASSPHCGLDTSGEAVGLPAGQMGNSEVGHMNIGAGRVVYQDFTRISLAIRDGSFFHNPALLGAVDAARASGGAVHIMGLLSPGGVHSHDEHF